VKGESFADRVLDTIWWYSGYYDLLPGLERLAKLIQTGSDRKDLNDLVNEIDQLIAGGTASAPAARGVVVAPQQDLNSLPAEIKGALILFGTDRSLEKVATALRAKVRSAEYQQSDLPTRLHSSSAPERKLIAILVLEANPNPVYLRWQAEAIIAGPPFLGVIAAQSLMGAALRLPPDEFPWVDLAVQRAAQLLNGLPINHPARKARQDVDTALTLCDMLQGRKDGTMSKGEVRQFLDDMTREFDLAGLKGLCSRQLLAPLELLARTTLPPEYVAVELLSLARDKWEPRLIKAAHLERPGVPGLASMHTKYPA
jgi:hypothetical protein